MLLDGAGNEEVAIGRRNKKWLLVGCPSYNLSGSAIRERHIHCLGDDAIVTPGMVFRRITCAAAASRETRDRLPSHLRPYLASDALQRGWGRERTSLRARLSCMCISSLSSVLA